VQILMGTAIAAAVGIGMNAQAPAKPAAPAAAPAGPTPVRIELGEGTKARYKVAEQLTGVSFGSDAVGTTEAVTGTLVFKADGSVDSAQSKLTVDLRTLKSDQTLRDMFLQMNTLQTKQHPMLEFVPTQLKGLTWPLPLGSPMPNSTMTMPSNVGFQMTGNMTLKGVTRPVTWNVVATTTADNVQGRATTTITFQEFNVTKPAVPLIISADDKIQLEVEFRGKRTNS
jgi:polyisoprenoid-binding protein YceI